MDRKDWLLLGCTLAIIVTLIGCTYWIAGELAWISRAVGQLQR